MRALVGLLVLALTGSPALARGVASAAQGPQGVQGAKGDAGPQGPAGPTGATGASGPAGPSGPAGAVGATGATGPAGIVPIYGPSGLYTSPKAWMGKVTSANGLWSASIAAAGCTSVPFNIQAQPLGTAQTAAGALFANVSSASATAVSGTVTQPTASVFGVLSVSLFTAAATTVWVEAFCQ